MASKTVTTANNVLHYRRAHPGGGVLGRCSYGVPGVPGIVVFDVALFLPGAPPATLTLSCPLAAPVARNVAGVTSAVVAAGAATVATKAGKPVATPATVAQAARKAVAAVVAATPATAQATPATPVSAAHVAQVG